MINRELIQRLICFITGALFSLVLCVVILSTMTVADATEVQMSDLGYQVYVNGEKITLNESFIKDGRTYVQLRELCSQMNVAVDWVDPKYHMLPIPGGNLPDGINLTNPTFVYTKIVTNYSDLTQKIACVEITGIYHKYMADNNLKYSFGEEGLVVKNDGTEKIIPLKYNPWYGKMYLSIDEFREKVQPYLVDICMQVK